MIFETLEELHKEWKVNGECRSGMAFNKSCISLDEVFEECPMYLRLWRLSKGYIQFAEHCDWSTLGGDDWRELLSNQPQLAEHCDWAKLDGYDWRELLSNQPQFAEHCDWSKLDGWDWRELLIKQPQFNKFKK